MMNLLMFLVLAAGMDQLKKLDKQVSPFMHFKDRHKFELISPIKTKPEYSQYDVSPLNDNMLVVQHLKTEKFELIAKDLAKPRDAEFILKFAEQISKRTGLNNYAFAVDFNKDTGMLFGDFNYIVALNIKTGKTFGQMLDVWKDEDKETTMHRLRRCDTIKFDRGLPLTPDFKVFAQNPLRLLDFEFYRDNVCDAWKLERHRARLDNIKAMMESNRNQIMKQLTYPKNFYCKIKKFPGKKE